jgi:hypothetical protein
MSHFINATLNGIIGLFFVSLGIIAMCIPFSPEIRTRVSLFLLDEGRIIFLFGFIFAAVGAGVLLNVIGALRKKTYVLKSGAHKVAVDEKLFRQYLEKYWQTRFPRSEISQRVSVSPKRIIIHAELPATPKNQHEKLLWDVQGDIEDLFARIIGYRGKVVFNATFPTEK